MSGRKDSSDNTPNQNPFSDHIKAQQPHINKGTSFDNLSDMSSCESNEFSNMDEKIHLGKGSK
jgi:hypothetical protein